MKLAKEQSMELNLSNPGFLSQESSLQQDMASLNFDEPSPFLFSEDNLELTEQIMNKH